MLTQLRTSDIKNAMYGSTQLSAVYKGSTLIWDGVAGELVLTRAYFKLSGNSSGCTRGTNRFDLRVLGTHTYDDPGRSYNIQYDLNNGFGWQGSESNWVDDIYTTTGVPFDVWGAPLCTNTSTPEFNTWCRMRFKLSDGTETEWSYFMAAKATDVIPVEILQESEIPDDE